MNAEDGGDWFPVKAGELLQEFVRRAFTLLNSNDCEALHAYLACHLLLSHPARVSQGGQQVVIVVSSVHGHIVLWRILVVNIE